MRFKHFKSYSQESTKFDEYLKIMRIFVDKIKNTLKKKNSTYLIKCKSAKQYEKFKIK